MVRRLPSLLMVLLLAVALVVAACGGPAADPEPGADNGDDDQGAATDTLTVGVMVPSQDNPFWVRYAEFVRQVADELDIEVVLADARNREDTQISDIESLLARGVDGLLVTPVTAAVGPTLINRAEEAGVPIMVTDRFPDVDPATYAGDMYVGFIGPNDVQAGYDIATALIEAGATKIVALNGMQGASVAQGRNEGLHQAINEHPNVELVTEQWVGDRREDGLNMMENYLSAYQDGEIDAVWAFNDNLAMGALQAIKGAGRTNIMVAGMDLNQDAVEAIQAGEYTFSTGGHWLQGGFGLIILHDFLNGIEPEEPIVKLNTLGVDQDNVEKFLDQYIDNPPTFDIKSMSRKYNPSATSHFEITIE